MCSAIILTICFFWPAVCLVKRAASLQRSKRLNEKKTPIQTTATGCLKSLAIFFGTTSDSSQQLIRVYLQISPLQEDHLLLVPLEFVGRSLWGRPSVHY